MYIGQKVKTDEPVYMDFLKVYVYVYFYMKI